MKFSTKQVGIIVLAIVLLLGLIQRLYPFIPLTQLNELGLSPKPEEIEKHRSAYREF